MKCSSRSTYVSIIFGERWIRMETFINSSGVFLYLLTSWQFVTPK